MSISITIDTSRAKRIINGNRLLRKAVTEAIEDSTVHILNRMKTYPAKPPGSNYMRTGTLRRSWFRRVDTTRRDIEGEVASNGNIAPYNREVQDATRQKAIHRGRWTTAQEVARDSQDDAARFFRTRIQQNFGT